MKKNELFIGALVNIYTFPNDNPQDKDLFPAKVSAISVFDPFKEPDDVNVELVIPPQGGIASRPLETCLPVPIRSEMLKYFGFTEVELTDTFELLCKHCEIEIWKYDDGIWVMKCHKFAGTLDEQVTVNWWHELQYQLNKWGVELCE